MTANGFPVTKKYHQKNDAEMFEATFKQPVPDWWPRYNNKIVRYVFRLLDEKLGTDIKFPRPLDASIYGKVQPNELVNFHDLDIKMQALRHVDKISDGRVWDRPFVSTSYSLDAVVAFASRKTSKGYGKWNFFVRIDLWELWGASLFTKTSFADLSSADQFASYFQRDTHGGAVSNEWIQEHGIDVRQCMRESILVKEIPIGLRGTWWPGYAELVSDADAVLQSQVGGYDETSFGSKIMNEYKAVPQEQLFVATSYCTS